MDCAKCDSIPTCPPCALNQVCIQSYPDSCLSCPVNYCVDVPNHADTGAIAGGVVGGGFALACLVGCGVALGRYFYMRRHAAKSLETQREIPAQREVPTQREIPMRRFVPPSAKTPSLPPFNIPRHEDSDSDAQSTTTSSILSKACAHALWRISEHTEPRATPHENTSPNLNAHGHAGPTEKEHTKRASARPHTSTDLDTLYSLPQAQQNMDEDWSHWVP